MSERQFETFLRRIERTSEQKLRELLKRKGYDYVDTPGFYHQEAKYYHGDVVYFFKQNAGQDVIDFYRKVYDKYGMKFFK